MTGDINSEMIRTARLSRGRHQSEVAEAIGVKQPTYSKIENGQVALSEESLARLSEVLEFPESFFRQHDRIWGTASPHHRRRKSLSPRQLEQLEAQLNIIRLQIRRLTTNVQFESMFDVPTLSLDEVDTPTAAARELRRRWRLPSGPIMNVTRMLEDAGVVIVERPMSPKIDAVSIWGPGESPIIFINADFSVDRKRQTLAHELGHLVMHASDVTDDPEGEANEFGRELLMPALEILPELKDLKLYKLSDLKLRWKCSMRNFVYHAQFLGEIDRNQARYLFMRLNQQFGAKSEPIDLPPEPPALMAELLQTHIDELGFSADDLAEAARASPGEFKTHFGLAPHLRAM